MMTVDQFVTKLNLLPLTDDVTVSYDTEDPQDPRILFEWGLSSMSIPLNYSTTNLSDMGHNLPLPNADRLASIAVLLTPVPIGDLEA